MSELRRRNADQNVVTWADSLRRRDGFLSVVTIREIEAGVLLVERRDPVQGARLRAWYEDKILIG